MMHIIFSPQGIGSVGLIFDIVGAVLLFEYGLPEEDVSRTGQTTLVTGGIDEDEKRKGRLYVHMGRLGLLLLIAGFVLQLAGNLMQLPR